MHKLVIEVETCVSNYKHAYKMCIEVGHASKWRIHQVQKLNIQENSEKIEKLLKSKY